MRAISETWAYLAARLDHGDDVADLVEAIRTVLLADGDPIDVGIDIALEGKRDRDGNNPRFRVMSALGKRIQTDPAVFRRWTHADVCK